MTATSRVDRALAFAALVLSAQHLVEHPSSSGAVVVLMLVVWFACDRWTR